MDKLILKQQNFDCLWDKLVVSIFTMEHFIILIVFLMRILIKNKPKWIRVFMKRQARAKY